MLLFFKLNYWASSEQSAQYLYIAKINWLGFCWGSERFINRATFTR